jgi:hypothetical protein
VCSEHGYEGNICALDELDGDRCMCNELAHRDMNRRICMLHR